MPENFIYADLTSDERFDEITNLLSKAILTRITHNDDKLNSKSSADREQKKVINSPTMKYIKSEWKRKNLAEQLLTTKEFIKFLKISRTTFWRIRKTGALPFYVVNNASLLRYKFSDVMRYVRKTKLNTC